MGFQLRHPGKEVDVTGIARCEFKLMLCVAWHPSGDFFVVGDYGTEPDDPVLQFWSADGELMKSIAIEGDTQIRNVSWNRDGSRWHLRAASLESGKETGSVNTKRNRPTSFGEWTGTLLARGFPPRVLKAGCLVEFNCRGGEGDRHATGISISCRTRRCSEREPAIQLRDKFNATGGWLPPLTSLCVRRTRALPVGCRGSKVRA